MLDKKAIVTSPSDLMKGVFWGLVIAVIIVVLAAMDIWIFAKIPFI